MKIFFRFVALSLAVIAMGACGGGAKSGGSTATGHHPYEGTYTTEYGLIIRLKPDSTSCLTFNDTTSYDGCWKLRQKEGVEYVNVEFAGNIDYYYLKNDRLYRQEQNMVDGVNGMTLSYQE